MINQFAILELKFILTEINLFDYTTVAQIRGAINSRIEELEAKEKGKKDE